MKIETRFKYQWGRMDDNMPGLVWDMYCQMREREHFTTLGNPKMVAIRGAIPRSLEGWR